MSTQKEEVIMLELFDKRKSNVFQTGTDDNPIFLDSPTWAWIPNEGMRVSPTTGKMEKIRYVENDPSILWDDQDARKIPIDRAKNRIVFEKGIIYLYKSEATENLIEYLTTATYCGSAVRPKNSQATILYDVVNLSKKAEQANEGEQEVVEALAMLYKLRTKKDGLYAYNDEKVDAYSKLLNIYGGETTAEKFKALTDIAKARPSDFVSLVSVFDNTIKTEVSQALQLKVISFEDNVASFADGNKIIKPFGSEKMNQAQKIEFISDYLKMPEASELLTEMRARVDSEKQKKLANK